MANPVRFSTIEKTLNLSEGDMEKMVAAGCPTAGNGVAYLDHVQEWIVKQQSGPGPDPEATAAPAPAAIKAEVAEEDGVEWVTIRVPIMRKAPVIPGTNPALSFRISSSERHIRTAWSALHHGCRQSHVTLRSGNHVDKVSHSLKFILEQLAAAIGN